MDLEGYAKKQIQSDENVWKLAEKIKEIKELSDEEALSLANAVFEETKSALSVKGDVFAYQKADVGMGQFGVGSRGIGDFYVHQKIGEIIGKTDAVLDSSNADDSGVVYIKKEEIKQQSQRSQQSPQSQPSQPSHQSPEFLVLTVDGIHSRLSSFPFLSGFHVAKAALRDIYVMGSKPLAMLSDIHVADDGDVAMIFDHLAGISAVSELTGIPLITGSTLRIGGDMVIGERMTGCVGAAGVADCITARNKAIPGDVILMTQGSGGGTITTAAIYSGYEKAKEVVDKTLNVDFLKAVKTLIDQNLHQKIHVMTDVTNGGIRGDALEISKEADVRLVFEDTILEKCIEPMILEMLDTFKIDFRGVSIDSLLVICSPDDAKEVIQAVSKIGVKIYTVGYVEKRDAKKYNTALIQDGKETEFTPLFREAAYTPLKKAIGEKIPLDFDQMKTKVDEAAKAAVLKRNKIVAQIKEREKEIE
ncbi:MAG: AIR synthase-related protein [Methanimicrococcus sp.]|nr:AIR synthase-related protein [Methanimicrococcus sp.]